MQVALPARTSITWLHSRPVAVLACLTLGMLIGFEGARLATLLLFGGCACLMAALCVKGIRWAICGLLFLSPFHYVIKVLAPAALTDIWRELLLAAILWGWTLGLLLGAHRMPRPSAPTLAVLACVAWAVLAIFNSVILWIRLI